jgi:hypothetical protein
LIAKERTATGGPKFIKAKKPITQLSGFDRSLGKQRNMLK